MRMGVRGLIIDPYNYIESGSQEEHSNISQMLTRITSFASSRHPRLVCCSSSEDVSKEDGTYAVPKGMNISGSAAWLQRQTLASQSTGQMTASKSTAGSRGSSGWDHRASRCFNTTCQMVDMKNILRRQSKRYRACLN